jgi:hypothetical protein
MSAAPIEEFEVEYLDAAGVLEAAAEAELAERRAALLKLRLAHQWAVLHPATTATGVATHGGPALDVLTHDESLGGDGTPAVAAFTPETFALRLGITPAAGAQLIGDALDLRHRLPLLWKRVARLQVPAWQARRVAQQTHRLPRVGARWVDTRLASRTDGALGPVLTDRLVALAVAKYDPEEQEQREAAATAASDVTISHPDPTLYDGTSDLRASGDTLILQTFHDLLCAIAHQLWLDGDTDPLGVRKIKAIALITALVTGQAALDAQSVLGPAATRLGKIRLHVRVDAQDLDLDAHGGAAFAVGAIDKLGAATMAKLREWVGHAQVEIQPVLNMARRGAVDQHDPPPWMQELVRLRDGHCVFPRCTVDADDCDLDHEVPYIPIDEGGPPGQTHPDGLACLCRRHHRAKTARVWRYQRTPEGHYLWHGPHGARYLRTPEGTYRI